MELQIVDYYNSEPHNINIIEKLLKEIFTDHVGVKDAVHFIKVSWSPKDIEKGSQRYSFCATSDDYLRIAKTIMNDFHSDTCIGDYLLLILKPVKSLKVGLTVRQVVLAAVSLKSQVVVTLHADLQKQNAIK